MTLANSAGTHGAVFEPAGTHGDVFEPAATHRAAFEPFRVAVVRFPGTNCESETVRALAETLGDDGDVQVVHHRSPSVDGFDAVVVPGGFSYGDYLRAGAIAARSPVAEALRRFAAAGGIVLGICNGFQILQELSLLPGALVRNERGRFVCGSATLRVDGRPCAATHLLPASRRITLPIAHGEGRFSCDDETLQTLEREGRIVLRYESDNPNGSCANVAAVASADGNVVGMMPHPERNADERQGTMDGALVLASLAAHHRREIAR